MINVSNEKPVIMIGSGGHAAVLAEILMRQNYKIIAVCSLDEIHRKDIFNGIKHLHSNSEVLEYDNKNVQLINGLGMMPHTNQRLKVIQYFESFDYSFGSVLDENAFISKYSQINNGVQILANAIVQTGSVLGSHTIINSGAIVEHDCNLGDSNHLATGSKLCGEVQTGNNVFIGAGASVIQNIKIGNNCLIAAGSILTEHLLDGMRCYPCKNILR